MEKAPKKYQSLKKVSLVHPGGILLLGGGGDERLAGQHLLDVLVRLRHGEQHLPVPLLGHVLEQHSDGRRDALLVLQTLVRKPLPRVFVNLVADGGPHIVTPHLLVLVVPTFFLKIFRHFPDP